MHGTILTPLQSVTEFAWIHVNRWSKNSQNSPLQTFVRTLRRAWISSLKSWVVLLEANCAFIVLKNILFPFYFSGMHMRMCVQVATPLAGIQIRSYEKKGECLIISFNFSMINRQVTFKTCLWGTQARKNIHEWITKLLSRICRLENK